MTFTPTDEQLAIVDAAQNSEDNLLVSALAGAAKTSTLVLIAEALPETQILCLAFNKKIADEMTRRLPKNCVAKTLNGLGHSVWGDAIGRRLSINASKTYDLLSAEMDSLDPVTRKEVGDNFTDIMRTIDFGKACGWIPDSFSKPPFTAKPLMSDDEFFGHIDEEYSKDVQDLIIGITIKSLNMAFSGECDFGDQILMPTVFHGAFPRYPLVLVDEAQDLSALNHAMLRKIVKKRVIAVGDPNQAIYGFRGAHEESMELLRREFSMRELMLTVSFRCPIKVVEAARWRAPYMKAPEWAKEGSVTTLTEWTPDDIPDQSAVICRNNAPLFSTAVKLLKAGRPAELYGNDIGKSLLKVMTKLGQSNMNLLDAQAALDRWHAEKKAKTKSTGWNALADRVECIRIFLTHGKTLGDAMAYAQHLFNSRGPIKLMTVHKSKGLEFPHVLILDEDLISDKAQDPNVRYVAITRAQETLTYIYSEEYVDA